ncbi:MAG: hypothetical protein ACI9OD_003937 [Limisphaerales bacterium]|jgi:hypothetical protein
MIHYPNMLQPPSLLASLILTIGLSSTPIFSAPANRTAPDILPDTTVVYVELSNPKDLIHFVEESRLRKNLDDSGMSGLLTANRQYAEFLALVKVIEQQAGLKWRPTLEAISAGGVYLAIDGPTLGTALLLKSDNADTLSQVVNTLIRLSRDDASNKDKPDPLPSRVYREVETFRIGDGGFAVVDEWFVFANKGPLGRAIIDQLLDGGQADLAHNKDFQAARKGIRRNTVWAYTDLNAIRKSGVAKQLFTGKTDNPGAELLFGGIADALEETPHATASLNVADEDHISLALAIPHDRADISESREFFFGRKGQGAAEKSIEPPGTLFSLTSYRDFSGMWLAADDLFNENQAAGLTKAESTLGLFFNGKDFVTDILAKLKPQFQFVLARQNYQATGGPIPVLKLPAGALVLHTLEPDTMQRYLRVSFQTIIGFVNIQATQQGRPPFELNTTKHDAATIMSAEYFVDEDERKNTAAKIEHNFSPTISQFGDYFVLSSTKQLAMDLIDAVAGKKGPQAINANTRMRLDAGELSNILNDNFDQLVASNQLKKGQTEAEATGEIKGLLSLLTLFREAALNLTTADGELALKLNLGIAGDAD